MYVMVDNVFIQKISIHCFQTFSIESVFQNYSNQYRMIVFFSYFGFDVFARSCKDHLTRKQQIRLRLGLRGRVLASVGLIPKPARIHRTAAAEPPPGKTVVALPKMGE